MINNVVLVSGVQQSDSHIYTYIFWEGGFPGGSVVKKALPTQEIPVRSLSWKDSPEKDMATNSSIFAWKIPWPKETRRLQSTRSQKNWTQQLNNSNSVSNSSSIRLLQNIEQCSRCYTVGPGWLSILNIAVYIFQPQTPNGSFPPPLV